MKFNPCGKALDFARRCYRVKVKPFRDSDIEVTWRWYPALKEAGTYPGWSFLSSRDWLEFHDEKFKLGEVAGAPRPFYYGRTNQFATGEHLCGTPDEFENGQIYDPNQNTQYVLGGLPTCCVGRENDALAGEDGPTAWVSSNPFYPGDLPDEDTPAADVGGGDHVRIGDLPDEDVPEHDRKGTEIGDLPDEDVPYHAGLYEAGGRADTEPEEACPLLDPVQLDQWYFAYVQDGGNYAWRFEVPPGDYCLQVRIDGNPMRPTDVVAKWGTDCSDSNAHYLASADPLIGYEWTYRGTDPQEPTVMASQYWFKSFNVTSRETLMVFAQAFDGGMTVYVRVLSGVSCTDPVPLNPIPWPDITLP